MFTSKGKAGEIQRQKFGAVDNGLDEAEVAALVSNLIDQNNDLLSKQEHLRSLTKLLEKAVLKAQEEADSILAEAEKEANAKVAAIITKAETEAEELIAEARQRAEESAQEKIPQAEQRASDIIKAAEEEAEAIKGPARREAKGIVTEARQKSEAAERQSQELLIEATEKVESIKGLAEEEASRLIADVKQQAECLAKAKITKAEEEGQKIIEEAMNTAEIETQRIRQKAEQILLMSKKLGEDEIRENFERFCEGLLSSSTDAGEGVAALNGSGQADRKQNLALYDGTVELTIPPPIALDRIVKLHRHLRGTPDIKIMEMKGTADKGLRMQLHLRSRTPLLNILEAMPEVKKASDPPQRAGSIAHSQPATGKRPVRRIVVTITK